MRESTLLEIAEAHDAAADHSPDQDHDAPEAAPATGAAWEGGVVDLARLGGTDIPSGATLHDLDFSAFREGVESDTDLSEAAKAVRDWAMRRYEAFVTRHRGVDLTVLQQSAKDGKDGKAPTVEERLGGLWSRYHDRLLDSLVWGSPRLFEGERGVGKSAVPRDLVLALGGTPVVVHLNQCTPESLFVVVPRIVEEGGVEHRRVKVHVVDTLRRADVVIIDEFHRAPDELRTAALEILSERTLQGLDFGWHTVVALDNPAGGEYQVADTDSPAMADRYAVVEQVTAADTGAFDYLTHAYAGGDKEKLKRVRAVVNTVQQWCSRGDGEEQKKRKDVLNPRRVEFLLWILDHNLGEASERTGQVSLAYGLPEDGTGKAVRFTAPREEGGQTVQADVTEEFLGQVCEAYGAAYVPPSSESLRSALHATVDRDWSTLLIATHGMAKTSTVKALCRDMGVRLESVSMSMMQPGTQVVSAPVDDTVDFFPLDRYFTAGPDDRVAVFLDEWNHADSEQQAEMMPVTHPGERELGGQEIHLSGLFAAMNPPAVEGLEADYGVNTLDPAVRDRFVVTLPVRTHDLPWEEWMRSQPRYREFVDVVLEWYYEDVLPEPNGSFWVSPRSLERLLQHLVTDQPVEEALMRLDTAAEGGGHANPMASKLPRLLDRLEGKEELSAAKLLGSVDEYLDRMGEDPSFHSKVADALMAAPVELLKAHRDDVVVLFASLDKEYRPVFMSIDQGQQPEKYRFFIREVMAPVGQAKQDGAV